MRVTSTSLEVERFRPKLGTDRTTCRQSDFQNRCDGSPTSVADETILTGCLLGTFAEGASKGPRHLKRLKEIWELQLLSPPLTRGILCRCAIADGSNLRTGGTYVVIPKLATLQEINKRDGNWHSSQKGADGEASALSSKANALSKAVAERWDDVQSEDNHQLRPRSNQQLSFV